MRSAGLVFCTFLTSLQIEVWEDPIHNLQSQNARQLRLILYTMYKREYEFGEILDLLNIWKFDESEQIYKKLGISVT